MAKQKASVRPYEEKDREAVAHVCLETASVKIKNIKSPAPKEAGEFEQEHLVPHMWALPYLTLSPDHCFVVEADGNVVGFILCTPDSLKFKERTDQEYIPAQREERPWLHKDWTPPSGPDEKLLKMLHYPGDATISNRYPDIMSRYPAHLHINILPGYAGKGYGRVLTHRLFEKLRSEDVPGIHLECAEDNANAIAFYKHIGMEEWPVVMDGGKSGRKGVYREMICNGTEEATGQIMVMKL